MFKAKSLEFIDIKTTDESQISVFSENSLAQVRKNYSNTISVANSFCNYITEKHRTKELGYQLAARKEALNVELNEAEQQIIITFENFKKRLEEEYSSSVKIMEIEIEKEKQRVGEKLLENKTAYEAYVKTSNLYKQMFISILNLTKEIDEKIIFAQQNGETHNQYYIRLCEENRILVSKISNILKSMDLEDE